MVLYLYVFSVLDMLKSMFLSIVLSVRIFIFEWSYRFYLCLEWLS